MEASRGSPEQSLVRRWVEALAFVAVWIAAGELLGMSINAYLLFGIPLTATFQLFVRKRPIKDLWVRGGPGLSLRIVSLKLAIPLALVPFVNLAVFVVKGQGVDYICYALAAIVGAGAAAYALGQFKRETWRYLGLCLATAGLLGLLAGSGPRMIAAWYGASTAQPTGGSLGPDALVGIESLLLYIPALCMMEEVAFRGAIDSHVRPLGEWHGLGSTIYGIVSAIVVSVLWGLWHYPIVPHASVIQVVAILFLLQVASGPFLSLLAQVGEPNGARVRARPNRRGTKRPRLRSVGRRRREVRDVHGGRHLVGKLEGPHDLRFPSPQCTTQSTKGFEIEFQVQLQENGYTRPPM